MSARSEMLDLLREKVRAPIEKHAGEILESFGGDKERAAAFQKARADLDSMIERLEEDELKGLRKELDAHAAELNDAIKALQSSLSKVKDAETAARVFWRVVGIAARIIALA
ncbi:MAG TPA: hypothetical protein VKG01_15430 [Thermoanaerobaculia bacterium]|nr:hypothetical protein [Thermoanaerobaculia bacterium]